MTKKYIDISKYQGVVDFDAVKAAGVDGVMIRAVSTNSSGLYIDPYLNRNYAECKRVGLPCGVYYYTYAQTAAQVDAELALLRQALAGRSLDLPVAVDVEENSLKPLSAVALTDLVIRAVKTIEGWGYYAMVYTYSYYQQTELDMDRLAAYDLWIANYTGTKPAGTYGIWQYSSRGRISGITGYVDCNYAYKDYAAIIVAAGLTGSTQPSADPVPAEQPKRYIVATSACTYGDAVPLTATLQAAADKLGNITVSCTPA